MPTLRNARRGASATVARSSIPPSGVLDGEPVPINASGSRASNRNLDNNVTRQQDQPSQTTQSEALPIPTMETVDGMSKEQLQAELVARGVDAPSLRLKDLKQKLKSVLVQDQRMGSSVCTACGKSEVCSRTAGVDDFLCQACRGTSDTPESRAEKRKRSDFAADIEQELRKQLCCQHCKEVMCPPIWQCKNGHAEGSCCGRGRCFQCGETTIEPIRNLALEQLADKISGFSCPYAKWGCKAVVSYSALAKHQLSCKHQPMCCPEETYRRNVPLAILGRLCKWLGKESGMVAHLKEAHGRSFHEMEGLKGKGKGKAEGPSQWWTEMSVSVPSVSAPSVSNYGRVEYFSADNGTHNFKLETRWEQGGRKGSGGKAFLCVSYVGEAKHNNWFVELSVGSRHQGVGEEGAAWGRRISWCGRVHDIKFAAKELEDRGEGLYLNGREIRAILMAAGQNTDCNSSSAPSQLPLRMTIHRDAEKAASEQFKQPLPAQEQVEDQLASTLSVLSQYLPSTALRRNHLLMQPTDMYADDSSDQEDYGPGIDSDDDDESDSYEEIDEDEEDSDDDDDDDSDDDDDEDDSMHDYMWDDDGYGSGN